MLSIDRIKEVSKQMAKCYPIKKVSLFGSYANGIASEDSDVDLLVEFVTPHVSLITLSDIKNNFENKLQAKVDVIHAPIPDGALIKVDKVIDVYEQ